MKLNKIKRSFRRVIRSTSWILRHPLTGKIPIAALWRYFCFHFFVPLMPSPIIYPWINGLLFVAKPGMAGIVGNIYGRLEDPEEMGLLIHFLRKGDLFVDVGANMGSYSLLASGICGAKSVAFEPAPESFYYLNVNRTLNKLEKLIQLYPYAVSDKIGSIKFTINLGTMNHVISHYEQITGEYIKVPTCTLDGELKAFYPNILKVDVEGHELQVLRGSNNILSNDNLKVIIIEMHGSENRVGTFYDQSHSLLASYGFMPFSYNPFKRDLTKQANFNRDKFNTIYIRDIKFVNKRIKEARVGTEIFKNG